MRFTRLYRLFLILLSPLLILNCGQLLDIMNELDKQEATAPNTNLGEPGKWTTLVYLDADNNLEGAGVADVQEMISRAPQYSGNKVYVLMDRIPGYSSASMPNGFGNFEGARLFEVTSAGTLAAASPGTFFTSTSLGANDGATEINMGDKDTLENFIKWGLAQADADGSKYVFLDIWDHGAGWGGNAYGGNAVAWDDTNSHDALSITEIRTAITNAHAAGTSNGKRVTILGFDACYMGTAENAFAFKDLVSIMVGSEETEPGNGWDYSKWLPSGDTSPADLGSQLVTSYGSYYNGSGNNITLSAYNLSQIPALEASINKFVDSLVGINASRVITARSAAQNYNENMAVDLVHFTQLIATPESNAIKATVSSLMIREVHEGTGVKNSFGMTIYFPSSAADYDTSYNSTILAQNTRWDEFIKGEINTYQENTTEPADATCGAEPNNTSTNAKDIAAKVGTSPTPCTGYIYTAGDVDFYKFGLSGLPTTSGADVTKTIKVLLSNIPAGANFDVLVYAPNFSPSSPIAVGAAASSNGDEEFSIELGTGKVTYTKPNLSSYNGGVCDPSDSNNTLSNYGYCYGQGTVAASGTFKFYVVVVGKNNSYSQLGKYTLTVTTGSGLTVTAAP